MARPVYRRILICAQCLDFVSDPHLAILAFQYVVFLAKQDIILCGGTNIYPLVRAMGEGTVGANEKLLFSFAVLPDSSHYPVAAGDLFQVVHAQLDVIGGGIVGCPCLGLSTRRCVYSRLVMGIRRRSCVCLGLRAWGLVRIRLAIGFLRVRLRHVHSSVMLFSRVIETRAMLFWY